MMVLALFEAGGRPSGAHGVVVSHPLRMRKALGSIPSVSMLYAMLAFKGLAQI